MSLPITGKDTKITITLDGALAKVIDKVTDFRVSENLDEVVTKVLGESGSYVDQEFVGFEGTIEFAPDTKSADELMDTIEAARIAGIPVICNVTDRTIYRDKTSLTYVYPDVKFSWERSARRGDMQKITLKWKTGSNRISV